MSETEIPPVAEVVDDVLRLTLATHVAGTSLDFARVVEATEAIAAFGPKVGAIVLTGSGANFSAGGNVRDFAHADDPGAYLFAKAGELHDFARALSESPVPVVAAVHGWAAGAALSFVLAADVAIGGPSTKLRPAYPGIGFTPDGGMSWLLPRAVGASRAREILLTDAVLDADEAVRLGILSRIVPDDEVLAEALKVAAKFVNGPREAYTEIKKLLAVSPDNTFDEQLDAERAAISAAANSATGREGVAAFIDKRRPVFPR
ncbi:enoyl-CoA hydratase/isomerase family protein [Nocardia camponoti]|uniref:Enoyl-CoA hydratase/isomerase n=1 Tax=Nocardia camponoti TaxID=1616106 RepID=A0A917QCB9_9NOCA|nr:enoyl-CoA hydratase-related protein [Nocardia camponoti]GGK43078.1 putative enoyl-CoA hydratase/isomerase [Nocardia camponoti]